MKILQRVLFALTTITAAGEEAACLYKSEIDKLETRVGGTKFVVRLLLPKIGWVYLQSGNYITGDRRFARKFESAATASRFAKEAVFFHRELDEN